MQQKLRRQRITRGVPPPPPKKKESNCRGPTYDSSVESSDELFSEHRHHGSISHHGRGSVPAGP